MRRIFGAEVVAVVGHVFAAVIREIVSAVIAFAATYVCTNHNAVANFQRNSLEVRVSPVSAYRRNRSDVLVSLNYREFQLFVSILGGVTLKRVLVRAADAGHFHFHQYTT